MFFNKRKMVIKGGLVVYDGVRVLTPIGYGIHGETVDLYFENGSSLSRPVGSVMIELQNQDWRPLR